MEAWRAQGPGRTSCKMKGWRPWPSHFLKNCLQGMKSIKEGNRQGRERAIVQGKLQTHSQGRHETPSQEQRVLSQKCVSRVTSDLSYDSHGKAPGTLVCRDEEILLDIKSKSLLHLF